MIMYLAAGLGWAFFRYIPPVVSGILNILAERKLGNIKKFQKSLIEKWGILADETVASQLNAEESEDTKPERQLSPSQN